jgi:hypothetical protein
MTLEEVLARVVWLSEAVEDGLSDVVRRGLDELESDLRKATKRRQPVCPHCRTAFDWPGQLEEHLRVHHPEANVAA